MFSKFFLEKKANATYKDMNAPLEKILTLCLLILYSNYVTEILRCIWLIGEFRGGL